MNQQKLDTILENQPSKKLKLLKNAINTRCFPNLKAVTKNLKQKIEFENKILVTFFFFKVPDPQKISSQSDKLE